MYGEKILISAADGMEQLISLFLLKIANPFYRCLEMWPILYVDFSKCRVVTLVALASLHSFYSLHLIDFPVLINIKWLSDWQNTHLVVFWKLSGEGDSSYSKKKLDF